MYKHMAAGQHQPRIPESRSVLVFQGIFNGIGFKCMVDSGASINVVSPSMAKALNLGTNDSNTGISVGTGSASSHKMHSFCTAPGFEVEGVQYPPFAAWVSFVPRCDVILGMPWLWEVAGTIDIPNNAVHTATTTPDGAKKQYSIWMNLYSQYPPLCYIGNNSPTGTIIINHPLG